MSRGKSAVFSRFGTDKKLETEGRVIDYGEFQIVVRRAGGANREYQALAAEKLRPIRNQLAADDPVGPALRRALIEVFAKTVCVGWRGVTKPDGSELPFSEENFIWLMEQLPDLWEDLQLQAARFENFRAIDLETDAGN